jgi:ATP-dependent exoDNAse (exonuclease V) alpha subunit
VSPRGDCTEPVLSLVERLSGGWKDHGAKPPRIIELVKTRIPSRFGLDSIREIQVLCPMNRGGVGARSLNIELQAALNPAGERKVERFGWTFAPGDKVMQIENDYDKEVHNGDIGYIDDVDPDVGELIARFDGRPVTYGFGELDMLVPAYATTIHKSQGSEYPAVVIPVMTQHYAMLQRNLLYTGVTRGKRLVVLVGQKKAVAAWPLVAWAQQAAMPVIGFLHSGSPDPFTHMVAAFRQGLKEEGYIDGQNVTRRT